ncbi:hypothetical protein J3R83DRAFT_3617 [Lanmaoa asiatica]|nr:hypothetical protein J3R83DRAFT_3617 [Lanmaoa asiatica]
MEERYNEFDRASVIYERWIAVRPEPRVWVKWAKFEEERGKLDKAREVFQTALQFFGDEEEQIEKAQAVFNAFAKMETRLKEYERARFALERLPRSKSGTLYAAYTKFEKQHGARSVLESTVLGKRRIQYEEEVAHDGRNYDVWFDYIRLEEGALRTLRDEGGSKEEENAAVQRVREVYERAVSHVPPGQEKRYWRRYIFLWLDYALFEEIDSKDYERARQVYRTALNLVPHKQFTFAKLWIMTARFEVRQLDLPAARRILGNGIGMCPKEALFKGYVQLEMDLREFDRVRMLYEKYLEYDPTNSAGWIKYAELETALEDFARAEAIFELGVSQSSLSMPEILWKAYIDFEVDEQGDREKARSLYERLISLSGHHKVWISYAEFEGSSIPLPRAMREEEEENEDAEAEPRMVAGDPVIARQVFERGFKDLRSKGLKAERVALLEAWKAFEETNGTEADIAKVQSMMPIVGRKQHVDKETGQVVEGETLHLFSLGHVGSNGVLDWELVFADDEREVNPASFKFLQMAHAWKNAQGKKSGGSTVLSGFVAATKPEVPVSNSSVRSSSRSQDVAMRGREEEGEGSDVASSDGE